MNTGYNPRKYLFAILIIALVLPFTWNVKLRAGNDQGNGWPMFHHDPMHTGVAAGVSDIHSELGPAIRWKYHVTTIPEPDLNVSRWTTTFPLGDLDGDGTLEVVVTSPGVPGVADNHLLVLKDVPGQIPPVERRWIITETTGLDMYSPTLADANGDQLLDVIYSTNGGGLYAVEGKNGQSIWEFDAGRSTEAGPTVADLDDDGEDEAILVTDCLPVGEVICSHTDKRARLSVLPVKANGINTPTWTIEYPAKLDSAVPAVADIDLNDHANRQAIIAGTWGGVLLVAWQRPDGEVISDTFSLSDLEEPPPGKIPAIRSSPLVWDFGSGPVVIFGWVPDPDNPVIGRISAIRLWADMKEGIDVHFEPLWTEPYDAWKSSVTLVPETSGTLLVAGYGLAVPPNSKSGPVGGCDENYLSGGIIALNTNGTKAWQHDYGGLEGNVRASAAVADIDGDGHYEVILPVGCYGTLYAYDANSGVQEWSLALGPRAQNSPSIGDLDGDGRLEIVVGSYDGSVWVLDSGARTYLPTINR